MSRRSSRPRALAIIVALVLFGGIVVAAGEASARPRLAVTSIDGDRRGEVADAILEAAERAYVVIEPRQVNRTADDLGYGELGPRELRGIAAALDADVVLQGELDRDDEGRRLRLHVYFVGSRRKKLITVLFGERAGNTFVRQLRENLEQVIDDGLSGVISDSEPETEAHHRHHADVDPAPPPRPVAAHPELRIAVGPSVTSRKLSFLGRRFDESPPPYANGVVPGVRLAAEAYPFAGKDSAMRHLGVALDFDQTVALNVRTPEAQDVPLPTTQRHWDAELRFRWRRGLAATSASLALTAGYASHAFRVDRAPLPEGTSLDMSDVAYRSVSAGLIARLPLGATVSVTASGKGLFGLAAGGIQDLAAYGTGRVIGVDGAVGIEIVLGRHVTLALAAEGTYFHLAFDGTGALTTGRDGDDATLDVDGATDRYLGGVVALAFTL